MLTDKIRVLPAGDANEPEDIFAYAHGLIFTDDLRNQHGDPGALVVYKSDRFGDIELTVADPQGEQNRKLFSHYLWNAGIQLAELIGAEEAGRWNVKGERVLELGAGTGLVGIVSALAGAEEVVITDYPAEEVLENVSKNVSKNVPRTIDYHVHVRGHEWGKVQAGEGSPATQWASTSHEKFTRVLAADCFWMPSQHRNLAISMLHFLSVSPGARVFVVAGFHTGRAKLAPFFDEAAAVGLSTELIYETDAEGNRRAWVAERDGGRENVTERKKWLVIAVLKRFPSPNGQRSQISNIECIP